MPTIVANVSGSPITLPISPLALVPPGGRVVYADKEPDEVIAALGGPAVVSDCGLTVGYIDGAKAPTSAGTVGSFYMVKQTTGDITLYVDPVAGDDANAGSSTAPLKTLASALARVPYLVAHNVAIYLKPGTYAEPKLDVALEILNAGITVKVEGTDWSTPTLATGAASGTFTSSPGNFKLAMTDAGWTANDLRGKFVKIISGSLAGQYLPIINNTADTLDVANRDCSGAATAQFAIVTPAAIIESGALAYYPLTIRTRSFSSTVSPTAGLAVNNIQFNYTGRGIYVAPGATASFNRCAMQGGTLPASLAFGASSAVQVWNCYVGVGVGSNIGISNSGGILSCYRTAVQCSSTSLCRGILHGAIGGSGVVQDCYIQGATGTNGTGVLLNGTGSIYNSIIKGCARGVYNNTFAHAALTLLGVEVSGCTGVGITLASDCGLVLGLYSGLACAVKDNAGHGIEVIAPAGAAISSKVDVLIQGAAISGNGGFGLKYAAGNALAFCNAQVGASVTMGTNTSGDFCIDGSTAIALADLRADPDKTLWDSARQIRLAAD